MTPVDNGDNLDLNIDLAPTDLDLGFEDIGQMSGDMDIDLSEVIQVDDIIDVRDQPGFQYPAMLISGIQFNDALRVLQTTYRKSSRLMDVWLDLGDDTPPVKQGQLPADLTTFLTMRYLGLKVTLYPDEDTVGTLDLDNPEVLEMTI